MLPIVRHSPLSEPQSEPIYNIYPSLQQDFKRKRHPGQNHNQTSTIDRQIIHSRRNRSFTTPTVYFNIPSSPTPNPFDLSSNTIQSTPQQLQPNSQQKTPNTPSDYLGSTPHIQKNS